MLKPGSTKYSCSKCVARAKLVNVLPRAIYDDEFWSLPDDPDGTRRCPDCGRGEDLDESNQTSFTRLTGDKYSD